ncbi:MAG: allophycocyanin subunit beta, partial [Cyanobacteria bacterium J06641_2]
MQDAVTTLIKNYDVTGRYFDRNAVDSLKSYFESGTQRIQAAAAINANAAFIVKEAGVQLFEDQPEL